MDITNILCDEYELAGLRKADRRQSTIDAKKLYVKFNRDYNNKTYVSIANDLGLTHGSVINLYNKAEWLTLYDPKARAIWKRVTNKPECEKTLKRMVALLDTVDDPEIYEYIFGKLEVLVKTKQATNWSSSILFDNK